MACNSRLRFNLCWTNTRSASWTFFSLKNDNRGQMRTTASRKRLEHTGLRKRLTQVSFLFFAKAGSISAGSLRLLFSAINRESEFKDNRDLKLFILLPLTSSTLREGVKLKSKSKGWDVFWKAKWSSSSTGAEILNEQIELELRNNFFIPVSTGVRKRMQLFWA